MTDDFRPHQDDMMTIADNPGQPKNEDCRPDPDMMIEGDIFILKTFTFDKHGRLFTESPESNASEGEFDDRKRNSSHI